MNEERKNRINSLIRCLNAVRDAKGYAVMGKEPDSVLTLVGYLWTPAPVILCTADVITDVQDAKRLAGNPGFFYMRWDVYVMKHIHILERRLKEIEVEERYYQAVENERIRVTKSVIANARMD